MLFSLFLWKYPTFFRDARIGFINYKVRLGVDLIQLIKGNFTLVDQWEITVAKHQDRPCIVYEGETLTFKQVEVRCNQYAHWALDHGFIKGDVIALFLPNSPDFFAIWMGLAKVGVESAFLNNNIRGASLLHGIKTCKARAVIVNQELLEHLTPIQEELQQLLVSTFTISGEAPNSIKPETRSQCAPPVIFRKNVTYQSPLYYIFTSGTTGLPKAAIMKHKKSMWVGYGYAALFRFTKEDRLYITLPQYHSAATTVGFGIMITSGCAIVLRKKFSATRFWKDVVEEDVTVFQYVGELCRYLCNTPTSPFQQQHKLRLAFGNGLRPDVWDIFRERFKIPQIGEFYASTEGNVIFVNRHNVRHSVGFAPCVLPFLHCARIIRYNIETDEVYTDANGYCQEAAPNEVGLLIGKMSTRYPFDGYVGDKSITNKKILRNVFSTGDSWFNTGDLFKEDQYRNMYFMDRIGDTFRWKGENVATTEVAQAISSFQQVYLITSIFRSFLIIFYCIPNRSFADLSAVFWKSRPKNGAFFNITLHDFM